MMGRVKVEPSNCAAPSLAHAHSLQSTLSPHSLTVYSSKLRARNAPEPEEEVTNSGPAASGARCLGGRWAPAGAFAALVLLGGGGGCASPGMQDE